MATTQTNNLPAQQVVAPKAKVTKTVAGTKRQKVAAKPEQIPAAETDGTASSAPQPPATDMTIQEDGIMDTAVSSGDPVLGKLDEIIKMQTKMQRAQAKTQKQVALILSLLNAEEAESADGEEPTVGKKRSRAVATKAKKEPSGFAKPSYLSPELCEFLDLPIDSQLPRTEVTKRLVAYVKEHDLQKESPNDRASSSGPSCRAWRGVSSWNTEAANVGVDPNDPLYAGALASPNYANLFGDSYAFLSCPELNTSFHETTYNRADQMRHSLQPPALEEPLAGEDGLTRREKGP
ncbi:hypothetical protein KFL_004900020 [Klebsormidium nitens]|uniref:DM2 domain-containing protein n=1 Tax=Klebsormidium nitens TaxID=105231 RepID=A0A1Y1IDU5_KLENI|nr:hypothetical protein KFL_004900020 [Klebsormidium nitens]|eukprot:GAQ89135.1 hypothetical protein KFL_004900020 [Klebsormidium nitens]